MSKSSGKGLRVILFITTFIITICIFYYLDRICPDVFMYKLPIKSSLVITAEEDPNSLFTIKCGDRVLADVFDNNLLTFWSSYGNLMLTFNYQQDIEHVCFANMKEETVSMLSRPNYSGVGFFYGLADGAIKDLYYDFNADGLFDSNMKLGMGVFSVFYEDKWYPTVDLSCKEDKFSSVIDIEGGQQKLSFDYDIGWHKE